MLGRRRTEIGDLPGSGKVVERETRDGVRVSGFQRVVPFPPRRVLTTSVVRSVEIIWEDGKEEAGVRARIEETGVDFSSVGAALGIGECLRAFASFSTFTFVFIIGNFPDVRVFTHLGTGTETIRPEGIIPIREFPFGGSLLRTVLIGCSTGFTHTLGWCRGDEMGVPVSKGLQAEGSSCATLGGLDLSP